jgi:hypothetical protein
LTNVSLSKEKQECSYFLFTIVFTIVRGDGLASLDPVPKSFFDFGSSNGSEKSPYLSRKLCRAIGMATCEFILSA